MTYNEILSNLCIYDKRNPDFIIQEDEDFNREPRINCFCDNCFYSRDKLATDLLKYVKEN